MSVFPGGITATEKPEHRPGEILLVRDSFKVIAMRLTTLALGIFTGVLVARMLGPEGRGALAIVMAVSSIFSMIGNLGLGTSTVYYLGAGKYRASAVFSHSLVLAVAASLVLLPLFIPLYLLFGDSVLKGVAPVYLIVAALGLPFGLLASHVSSILLGIKHVSGMTWATVLSQVVITAFIFVALVVLKAGVVGVLAAGTLGGVVSALLSVAILGRRAALRVTPWDSRLVKDVVTYGVKAQTANLIMFLNYRLDHFLINLWVGTQALGYYVIATNMAEMLWLVPLSAVGLLLPQIAGLSKEESGRRVAQVCRHATFISLGSCLALGLTATLVIRLLYGEAFLPSVLPLLLLLPGVFVIGSTGGVSSYFAAQGMIILAPILTGVGLVLDVGLNLVMIPRWGIEGAALASTVSYSLQEATAVFVFLRSSRRSFFDTFLLKPEDLRLYFDVSRGIFRKLNYAARNTKVYLGR